MLLDSGQKALCMEVIREFSMDMAALGKAKLCSGFPSFFSVGGEQGRSLYLIASL